ncbi:MAG TPA: hypothetical protein VF313_11345, partial [Anaerolineaceae bacterium]
MSSSTLRDFLIARRAGGTIHTGGRRGIHHGGTEKCGLFSRPSLPRDPPWAAPIPHVETHDMRLHDMRLHGKPILRTRLENVS